MLRKGPFIHFTPFEIALFLIVVVLGLIDCAVSCTKGTGQSSEPDTEYAERIPYSESAEHEEYFKFWLNYLNITDEIVREECVAVINDEGVITNSIITWDNVRSALSKRSRKINFAYLGKSIDVPEVADDQIWVIDVDYATGEINTWFKDLNDKRSSGTSGSGS